MNPVPHPSNTHLLKPPPNWDQERVACDSLPVTMYEDEGVHFIVSFWQPSKEQLDAMLEGKPVALQIIGAQMPPVMLGVAK